METKKYPNFHPELFVTHEGIPCDQPVGISSSGLRKQELKGYYEIFETPENVLRNRADGPMAMETCGRPDPTLEKYVGHYVLKEVLAIRAKPEIRRVTEGELFVESL